MEGLGQIWEFLKNLPLIVTSLVTLALGWLVTARITARWELRKKHAEINLDAINRFYSLYGEFFAVWKIWESMKPYDDFGDAKKNEDRKKLLERAAAAEGQYEALLVKLAIERRLKGEDLESLARFREGLQCLRESIKDGVSLRTRNGTGIEWRSDPKDGPPSRAKAYREFRRLAIKVNELATQRKFRRGVFELGGETNIDTDTIAEDFIRAASVDRRKDWWTPKDNKSSIPSVGDVPKKDVGGSTWDQHAK